jgi:hypothetical protein
MSVGDTRKAADALSMLLVGTRRLLADISPGVIVTPAGEVFRFNFVAVVEIETGARELRAAGGAGATDAGSHTADWVPASEAVLRARKVGLHLSPSLLWRWAKEGKVSSRAPQLPGKHRLEVELTSLVVHVMREAKPRSGEKEGTGAIEGSGGQGTKRARTQRRPMLDEVVEGIERRKKEARATKERGRCPD